MKTLTLTAILFIIFIVGCSSKKDHTQIAETKVIQSDLLETADFGDLILISGEYVIPFCQMGGGIRGNIRKGGKITFSTVFYLCGYHQYRDENESQLRKKFSMTPDEKFAPRYPRIFLNSDYHLLTMYDGKVPQLIDIYTIKDMMGVNIRKIGPNPDIKYISFKDNIIHLWNGFVGSIDTVYIPPDEIAQIPFTVEIEAWQEYTQFGEKKEKKIGIREELLCELNLVSIDYLCNSINGLKALLDDLGKEIEKSDYHPLLYKLTDKITLKSN